MKKPVDYKNLTRVIQAGVRDACKEAGLERFALSVEFTALVVVGRDGAELTPNIDIQVTELTEEQSEALHKLRIKMEGN